MFSKSNQNASNSQTPLSTILNTPALRVEFALLIFVCIDHMRRNLAATFEVDPSHQASSTPKSPPGFPAAAPAHSHQDAQSPYARATAKRSENLIDLDKAISSEPSAQRNQPRAIAGEPSRSKRSLKPYEEWDIQQLRQRLEHALASSDVRGLRRAALTFFDTWRMNVLRRVGTTLNVLGDTVRKEKAKREAQRYYKRLRQQHRYYEAIPTSLVRLEEDKRNLLVQSTLLLLLGLENYPSHSRSLLLFITSSLELSPSMLTEHEISTAKILLASTSSSSSLSSPQSPPPEQKSHSSLNWRVGLAAVGGAALIGITGGLAAPLIAAGLGAVAAPIMGAFGLGGLASLLGALIGNSVLVGTLFGIMGGRRMADVVERLSRDVEDFELVLLDKQMQGQESVSSKIAKEKSAEAAQVPQLAEVEERLRVTICASGSLLKPSDLTGPWTVLGPTSTAYVLQYESELLLDLGRKIENIVHSAAFSAASYFVLKNTVFATLMAGLYWPLGLLKAASVVDNPFNVALARSDKAGVVLAQVLIAKAQGERPVNLVGFGLGARVIWQCCKELSRQNAFGLVGDVVLMGLPGPAVGTDKREIDAELDWRRVRSVVAGRLVNCYSSRDWILKFLYRIRAGLGGIAGMEKVETFGVENEDVSDLIDGHASYGLATGAIMERIGIEVDETEVRKQTETATEVRRENVNEQRRAGQSKDSIEHEGKVEMVDEKSGKIVMLDLESGAVDERKQEPAHHDIRRDFETLHLRGKETKPAELYASSSDELGGIRAPDYHAASKRSSIATPSPASAPRHDGQIKMVDNEDSEEEEGEMELLAPEPEPEPENVSFGNPNSGINMTWQGR